MPACCVALRFLCFLACAVAHVSEYFTTVASDDECASGECSLHALQLGARKGAMRKPNILLVILDSWRFDWAGFHESNVSMPTVASLAERGTRFNYAFVPSPLCTPSRAALAAARSYTKSPVKDQLQDFPMNVPTYFSRLQAAGYYTMVVGKDDLSGASGVGPNGSFQAKNLGFDAQARTEDKYTYAKRDRPIEPYGEFLASKHLFNLQRAYYGAFPYQHPPPYRKILMWGHGTMLCREKIIPNGYFCPDTDIIDEHASQDEWIERQAERLLTEKTRDSTARSKPWFLLVNFNGGHPPLILTRDMNRSVEGRNLASAVLPSPDLSPAVIMQSRRQYTALIENSDVLLSKLLKFIEQQDSSSDNLIILTSDQGEMLGDYGRFGKMLPLDASTRVPLVIAGPGVSPGLVVTKPVSTLGVAATIMETAGATPALGMDSVSLWPALRGGEPQDETVASGLHGVANMGMMWQMAVKQFNSSVTLKLLCCLKGCPESNLLRKSTGVQVALLQVTQFGDGEDVLARGEAEARELLAGMPDKFRNSCGQELEKV